MDVGLEVPGNVHLVRVGEEFSFTVCIDLWLISLAIPAYNCC